MKLFFTQLMESISVESESIDMEDCNIPIEDAFRMIEFTQKCLLELRDFFLKQKSLEISDEITFFKKMKPEILSKALYFNEIYNIELKRPNGSNEIQRVYYENELNSLTYFFNRNLDFYQYYRSNSTHLDKCYFVRSKTKLLLCIDSSQFIQDPLFSTGYDFKVAKILANEMLRIYLNKQMNRLERQLTINKNKELLPTSNIKWTGSKVAAIEFGYALHASSAINKGQTDVKEVMAFIETFFNIDLGDYYRTYIAIKGRKKDRTPFLNSLINGLIKKMDEDDSK